MKSKRILFLAIFIAVLAILYFYFRTSSGATNQNAGNNTITVAAVAVAQKNVTTDIQAIGTVQPMESVSLKSLVDGQIFSVNFKEGAMVQKGQLLVTIDPRPLQVQVQTTMANLAKDQAQLTNAKSQLERGKKLLPDGYIAKQDFDTLRANVASLSATVEADQAVVANAKLQLSYTKIYSPLTGKTGNLLIKPGNLVKGNDTNALVVINQISPINVVFSIPQQELAIIRAELLKGPITIKAHTNNRGKSSSEGLLTFIDNSVDTTTGTIQMKGTFNNEDQSLWPGEFVTLKLPTGVINNALIVPTLAVQNGPNGNYVFVIAANKKVTLRSIKIGPHVGNNTIIQNGLKVGEQVVTEGQLRLTDNAEVQIAANP